MKKTLERLLLPGGMCERLASKTAYFVDGEYIVVIEFDEFGLVESYLKRRPDQVKMSEISFSQFR
jgi:hypothetical protein